MVDGFTVVACNSAEDGSLVFTCVNDAGELKHVPFGVMESLLAERPGFIRNLSAASLYSAASLFPTEHGGNLAGTVLHVGFGENGKKYRVFGKRDGAWYIDTVDEAEAILRTKRGLIVNASIRGGRKLLCKCPVRNDLFESADTAKQTIQPGKRVDISLLYVTEASDEHGNKLRYAGVEYTGTVDAIESLLPVFTEKSLMLRQDYYTAFGRSADELSLQTIPGRAFVVLPYSAIEKQLLSGKRPVKISRVVVSSLAFRCGSIFDESKIVLSGVLGNGEVRGTNGYLDESVKKLADEVLTAFKFHVSLRTKYNKQPISRSDSGRE